MERIKTEIRVQAFLRRCAVDGFMGAVVRRGDADAGALFLKINRFAGGCEVFSSITGPDGHPAWLRALGTAPVPEKDADAYLARQMGYDADLWVLEIEDPKSKFTLNEAVLDL